MGWYKPKGARLFHLFMDGKSLCGAFGVTRPLRPARVGDKGFCGSCRKVLESDLPKLTSFVHSSLSRMSPAELKKWKKESAIIMKRAKSAPKQAGRE